MNKLTYCIESGQYLDEETMEYHDLDSVGDRWNDVIECTVDEDFDESF